MKKEDITGLIVWLLLAGGAALFFFLVLREYYTYPGVQTSFDNNWLFYMLFFVGAMVGGLVFNAILFELCHMLGAKMGRYIVTSVNVLGFNFYKDEKRIKFRIGSYDGLTGETKIYPKKNVKKEPDPTAFLLVGTFAFAIEIIAIFFAFNLMKDSDNQWVKNFAYFILTFGLTGALILVYNIIPLHLDNMTDGYRLRMVSSSKNKQVFNDILRAEGAYDDTVIARDEVEEKKEEEEEDDSEDLDTAFSADIGFNKVYKCLEKENYDRALEILERILSSQNVAKKVYLKARSQKIWIILMTKGLEEAQAFYENEVPIGERREISDDNSMPSIRAYILMSGLMDKSKSECLFTIKKVNRVYKYSTESKKGIEKVLFNKTIDKVHEAHPKWELDAFKMNK